MAAKAATSSITIAKPRANRRKTVLLMALLLLMEFHIAPLHCADVYSSQYLLNLVARRIGGRAPPPHWWNALQRCSKNSAKKGVQGTILSRTLARPRTTRRQTAARNWFARAHMTHRCTRTQKPIYGEYCQLLTMTSVPDQNSTVKVCTTLILATKSKFNGLPV